MTRITKAELEADLRRARDEAWTWRTVALALHRGTPPDYADTFATEDGDWAVRAWGLTRADGGAMLTFSDPNFPNCYSVDAWLGETPHAIAFCRSPLPAKYGWARAIENAADGIRARRSELFAQDGHSFINLNPTREEQAHAVARLTGRES